MLFAIELSDEVDPTAIATLALALMTLASVLLTLRSLHYTKRALAQTHREIELSRQEVEEAHRPVLIPIVDATRKMRPDQPASPTIGPQLMSRGVLWVPVENIGSGPALDIEVSIAVNGSPAVPPADDDPRSGMIAGLGVDRLLPVEIHEGSLTAITDFAVTITYTDVAGKAWQTTAGYVAGLGRYEELAIGPAAGAVT